MFNPLIAQPADLTDFSGGITDNYLDCALNQYQSADNLLITDNKKLLTRPGSSILDSVNYLPLYTAQNNRTGLLFVFEDVIFENQGRNIYFNLSGYQTLTGPTGNLALPSGSSTNKSSWAYWNHHLIVANDSFGSPQKIFKDGSGNFQIRNAGLPKLASTPSGTGSNQKVFDFANDLKAKFNAHIADTAQHTSGADTLDSLTSPTATTLSSLITLINEMLTKFTAHEADSQKASAWSYHKAKATVSRALASVIAPVTIFDCVTRLTDLQAKFNNHDNDGTAHAVAASHQETLAAPAARNYLYSFLYSNQYTVGSVAFKDLGSTTLLSVPNVDMPSDNAVSITGIPVISNGSTENYDTANIKVEIYRTIDSGQTFFFVGSVTNGTTTFSDTASDDTIQANSPIYTDGDVLDNDPPPKAKYVVVVNDICWYLHVKEGTEVHTNRIRQSVKYDFDSCPASFFDDTEEEITGGASIGMYPIVFCKNKIYRIEGFYDLLGRGGFSKIEISRTAGCVSHLGIVVTIDGVYFPGNDGFYWTNGYQVTKISGDINTTYQTLIQTDSQKLNIYGAYDAADKRVYWATQQDQSSGDNDSIFIADTRYITAKGGIPFTTQSGGSSFAPSALLFYKNYLYRADKRGYLFKHDDQLRTDPKVDVLSAPSNWQQKVITYNYRSCASAFGAPGIRKWVPYMIIHCKNGSNMSLGINSLNDDSSVPVALKEVRALSNILWGDSKLTWEDPTIVWNYATLIKAKRMFPAGSLRCDYKQIQLTNSYTIIENSDSLGVGNIDSVLKTVTLTTAPTNIWPIDAVDYFISFAADGYTQDFLITNRTDSVLTYSDALNVTATLAGSKWEIKGYRKSDILHLLNYTIYFAILSSTQDPFRKAQTGANS